VPAGLTPNPGSFGLGIGPDPALVNRNEPLKGAKTVSRRFCAEKERDILESRQVVPGGPMLRFRKYFRQSVWRLWLIICTAIYAQKKVNILLPKNGLNRQKSFNNINPQIR
jgi:hypothetical protein